MNIDGKALAQELRDNLKTEVKQLQDDRGITPGLTVVLVGRPCQPDLCAQQGPPD